MAIAARVLTIFSLIVTLVALGGSEASANHAWGPYHWGRTANPFTLALGDNLTTVSWKQHLGTASADWSQSTVLDTTIVTGSTTGGECRASLGTVQVCNAAYGINGWLGLAQIWVSRVHIVQGVAKMNDTYFNTATYNNPNEKQHVMCQEVGHTFGLGHQDETGKSLNTCMDYFSNTGTNATSTLSTRPNQHDYDQLVKIYGKHTDLSNTFTSAQSQTGAGYANPAAGFAEDGTPFGASRARGDVYVTDLGGGRWIITFITWAK